jgi:hypothetical protein
MITGPWAGWGRSDRGSACSDSEYTPIPARWREPPAFFAANDTLAGLHRPSSKFYQRLRDYWAIGFGLTAIGGLDFDFHPVELADLVVGLAAFDLLNDDFARTRGLRLRRSERNLLYALHQIKQSEKTMQAYRASLRTMPVGAGP